MQWWMRPGPSRSCAMRKPSPGSPSTFVTGTRTSVVADLAVRAAGVAHHRHGRMMLKPGRVGRDDDLAQAPVRLGVGIGHRHHDRERRADRRRS